MHLGPLQCKDGAQWGESLGRKEGQQLLSGLGGCNGLRLYGYSNERNLQNVIAKIKLRKCYVQ